MVNNSLQLRRGCRALVPMAALLAMCVWSDGMAQAQTVAGDGKNSLLTVPVEGDLDAIFFYDDLTRDLTGFVLNNEGVFNIAYKANLENFFRGPGGKAIKDPKFLFATGKVSIRARGRLTFGGGAIYITESKTGQMVALALPWSKAYRNQRTPLALELIKIKHFALRNVEMDE